MYKPANVISLILTMASGLSAAASGGSPSTAASETTQTGYAIVSPLTGNASDLLVYRTLRFELDGETSRTEAQPTQLTTTALLFVETDPASSNDLGIAIANPNKTNAKVTLTLRRDDGILLGSKTFFIPPGWQNAQFVTQLFAEQPIPAKITGTLSMTSTVPVAVLAVKFHGLIFNAETVSGVSSAAPVPVILPGVGGDGASFLPDFAAGGGWSTQIALINTGTADITVRIDLFTPTGDPLRATLGGTTNSTFYGLRIRAGGVLVVDTDSSPAAADR